MSTMRNYPSYEVPVSETYHGARMNQKALNFHTQLHEWNEAQHLVTKHTQLLTASRQHDLFLPVKKLAQIEYWARQVNKYYLPYKNGRPRSGSFMKIDVSKFNMKVEKDREIRRSKSAFFPKRQPIPNTPASSNRPVTSHRRKLLGTDMDSVKNNIVESQLHYSAQRNDLYSATTRKSTNLVKIEDTKTDHVEGQGSDISDYDKPDNVSETVTITDLLDGAHASDTESPHIIDPDVMQPHIVTRSWSNRMLNVISIDDCKLTCRYRPQIIKESGRLEDSDKSPRAYCQRVVHKSQHAFIDKTIQNEESRNGNEADDEAEASGDEINNVQGKLDDLQVNNGHVDSNNNSNDACHNNQLNDQSGIRECSEDMDTGTSSGSQSRSGKIQFKERPEYDSGATDLVHNFSSRGTSKTSYGRVTNINSTSDSSKTKENKRKKVSRASRINHAINDVVKDRKVMNSLERDFDTRTAEFGRTVVESTDGSDTFKKLHANLRKKIDQYMDTHSAIKTKVYFDKVRKNSESLSANGNTGSC